MRYYFQDAGQKIATKCIRVSSTASTQAVIETLIEKFRPDMKMLHMAEYALYEIHPNGGKSCNEKCQIGLAQMELLTMCYLCRGEMSWYRREATLGTAELAQRWPGGTLPLEESQWEINGILSRSIFLWWNLRDSGSENNFFLHCKPTKRK